MWKWPFKVICCCANQRGIYDFQLALNRNLTSIFNCSWDITPSLHLSIPPFSSLEKMAGGVMDMLWCQGAQNIGLSNHKLKSMLMCTVWSQCMPVPDRRTDIMAIVRRFVLTNTLHSKSSAVQTREITEVLDIRQEEERESAWIVYSWWGRRRQENDLHELQQTRSCLSMPTAER